ncbi:uncharacterized protein LOC119401676 [Rhipicephalus sanguineus]|uniref:uncharacterized protein LOC119401676 n=1 Tax=Rhipicephalus sanguineus TaxID=34632 RepID=UPI0020C461FB|nr:uncharacterized protein LOC119401676 [Rhipicephalus sanguineus]
MPTAKEHSTVVNVMNNSTSASILNASAVASLGMSPTDLVEVHLLELPDVVQDTISAAKSTQTAAAIEPTTQTAPANATSQESANPCPPELLLPHAKKVEILADVRAGKLSKAEIVYKYHIRWAILYDVIRSASEIDAEQRRLGLAPETPDSHPVRKITHGGFPTANTKANVGNISITAPVTTTKETGKAGGGTSTKKSKPPPADLRAVSSQTLRSLGKGSLMTFMSTTNGTDAMTQVNHRRQADKGSSTATRDFQKLLSEGNPDGDGEGARSPEHLRHLHGTYGYSKANRGKVIGTRRSNAAPSPQPESMTEPMGAPASAQSPGFTVTIIKQEVDSDAEDVMYDPLVVPKQEPLSPQEEEHCDDFEEHCDDFEEHCDDFEEHCDDFVMKCEVDADDSDEQTLQPPPPVVTSTVSQWDNVTVKTEPPSP